MGVYIFWDLDFALVLDKNVLDLIPMKASPCKLCGLTEFNHVCFRSSGVAAEVAPLKVRDRGRPKQSDEGFDKAAYQRDYMRTRRKKAPDA